MALYSQLGYGGDIYGYARGGPIYAQPVSYYLGLLTSEYRLAPNLNKWLTRELNYLDGASTVIQGITEAYDLDSAVGVQLDVLGSIVGGAAASRTVGFQPTGSVSPVLDDDTYRLLIRATIANNLWDGTQSALYPLWASLFPGGTIVIEDQQNMSCNVIMSGTFTSIIKDLISNGYIVPRPEAVQYAYIFAELPIFGFDLNTDFIAGLDVGHFA